MHCVWKGVTIGGPHRRIDAESFKSYWNSKGLILFEIDVIYFEYYLKFILQTFIHIFDKGLESILVQRILTKDQTSAEV